MALVGLPPDSQKTGEFTLVTFLHQDGVGKAFGFDGMSREEVVGQLTTILDRLREEIRLDWPTCPDCGRAWEDHFEDSEDDDGFQA